VKKIILGSLAAAAIALGFSAGTANATSADAAFLGALAEQGIYNTTGPDYGLIQTGYQVCSDLSAGVTVDNEAGWLQRYTQWLGAGYLSPGDAYYFIGASQAAYCPSTYASSPQLSRAV
jgi:hypothetical protein